MRQALVQPTASMLALAAATGGALALVGASPALAEPEQDLARQTLMVQRFEVFDKGGGSDWEAAFPAPFVRAVAQGTPEPVMFPLKPGAYMIVVLCNCQAMAVSLLDAKGTTIAPLRSNDQAAMYSLDVDSAGDYLTGIDMNGCGDKTCDVGVKVYRKKS
jgi:hypothetical protein